MKTETSALLNAPPWSPIRGRIVGRLELLFVRDRGAWRTHRRLVGRYDLRGMELRDRELAVPAFEAAWAGACRVAKHERNKQRRLELGNERARLIQDARRREAEAARVAEGIKPELNLTIKSEWLDAILYRGKREEYRAADNRQCLRLWRECECGSVRHFPLRPIVAIFRAGYSMGSRAAAVLIISIAWRKGFVSKRCDGSVHRDAPCEHWGEPREEPHFALGIQRVLTVGSYSFVRDWVATPDAARAVAVARAEGLDHA